MRERTSENIYDRCIADGYFTPLFPNEEQVKTMLQLALTDLEAAKEWVKKTPKESGAWNAIYKLHYDILHSLIEAFLRLGKIKARTHECLFAHVCIKHPELELSWNFFEKIRSKRNRSLYYGDAITYQDWKEAKLQLNLYINTLKKAIEEKLK